MYREICHKLQLNPVVLSCCFNPLHSNISMQFLYTVLYTCPKLFTRRVCPRVKTILSLQQFLLSSGDVNV